MAKGKAEGRQQDDRERTEISQAKEAMKKQIGERGNHNGATRKERICVECATELRHKAMVGLGELAWAGG